MRESGTGGAPTPEDANLPVPINIFSSSAPSILARPRQGSLLCCSPAQQLTLGGGVAHSPGPALTVAVLGARGRPGPVPYGRPAMHSGAAVLLIRDVDGGHGVRPAAQAAAPDGRRSKTGSEVLLHHCRLQM